MTGPAGHRTGHRLVSGPHNDHFEGGGMVPGPDPEDRPFGSFAFFSDPDGNSWALQQGPR